MAKKSLTGCVKGFLDEGAQHYKASYRHYSVPVVGRLDLKTLFDSHCIFSESMFVLLENKTKMKTR